MSFEPDREEPQPWNARETARADSDQRNPAPASDEAWDPHDDTGVIDEARGQVAPAGGTEPSATPDGRTAEWHREHDGQLSHGGKLPTDAHADARVRVAGIFTQTVADLDGRPAEHIADVLRRRFTESGLHVDAEEIERMAASISQGVHPEQNEWVRRLRD